jgi:hypothetical protein
MRANSGWSKLALFPAGFEPGIFIFFHIVAGENVCMGYAWMILQAGNRTAF